MEQRVDASEEITKSRHQISCRCFLLLFSSAGNHLVRFWELIACGAAHSSQLFPGCFRPSPIAITSIALIPPSASRSSHPFNLQCTACLPACLHHPSSLASSSIHLTQEFNLCGHRHGSSQPASQPASHTHSLHSFSSACFCSFPAHQERIGKSSWTFFRRHWPRQVVHRLYLLLAWLMSL